MACRLVLNLILSYVVVTLSSDSCPRESVPDTRQREFGTFHWQVLGVADRNETEKRDRLVDVLLTGFDCERRIQNVRCRDGTQVNKTCQEVKRIILNNIHSKNGTSPTLALRTLIVGVDLERILCYNGKLSNYLGTDGQHRLCRVPPSLRYMDRRLSSKWQPDLMRHLVWRGCPNDVAFLLKRKCYHPNNAIVPCAYITTVVSHLIQGHRILPDSHQPCDIDYVKDIFREFGNSTGPTHTWHIDKHGLASILQNLSNPYPPLPISNTSSHSHSWEHGSRPNIPHWGSGSRPAPGPWVWGHGFGTQERSQSDTVPDRHDTVNHGHNGNSRPVQGHISQHRDHMGHGNRSQSEMPNNFRHRDSDQHVHAAAREKRGSPFQGFPARPHSSHTSQNTRTAEKWNASRLIYVMTGSKDNVLTIPDFYEICPTLLHHLLFVLNLPAQTPRISNNSSETSKAEMYGYSSLSVFIITLCSLSGIIFVKIAKGHVRNYVMAAMLALAVGNLCGDAVLHLVPEVIGPEGTDVDGDGHFTNEVMLLGNSDIKMSSVNMMLVLASIYAFFLLEMITSIYHSHDHDVETVVIPESQIPKKKALTRITGSTAHLVETTSNSTLSSMEVAIPSADSMSSLPSVPEENEEPEPEIQVTITKTKKEKDLLAPMTLAWMVIIGDAIHNFADGLEIGATFSSSMADGLSTSLAVFCHEVPHELGDFAVLISTGMSIKRALILNFVSGLTAFIGLYIGIVTGKQQHVRILIFAVGAGMFLYVALANLVPELMKYFQRHRDWKMFLCQNIGLLSGYVLMVIIAIYEDEITL